MKIDITTTRGVVETEQGTGIYIENIDLKNYAFKDLWDDLQGEVSDGNVGEGQAALTYEAYRDTGFLMYFMRHNQTDIINIIYQMPHSWNLGAVQPHVHVIPMASTSGNAYFSYSYSWLPFNQVLGAISSWTTGNVILSLLDTDQYKHKMLSLGTINPPVSGAAASNLLFIKLSRLGTDDLDTYTGNKTGGTGAANLGFMYLDLHYQKLKAGTITQIGD